MNPDPLRPPETDQLPPYPDRRTAARDLLAVFAALAIIALIAYLVRNAS